MSSELTFGLLSNGNLIHILESINGDSCNCICPFCKSQLTARQGKVNSWCFAHKNKDECEYGQETALHQFAKNVLSKYLKIKVPSPVTKKNASNYITFDRVEQEKRINNIIPDVILYKGQPPNENKLLVEIKVTHAVDDLKLDKIKAVGISAIEIDLSNIDFQNFDKQSVENLIIEEISNKYWLYNKAIKNIEPEKEKLISLEYHLESNDISLNSFRSSEITIRKPNYSKMETSKLLEKYNAIKDGKLKLNQEFSRYSSENTVISYVRDIGKLRPEPNICEKDECTSCNYFVNRIDIYDFIDNTCYITIKCSNPKMNIDNLIGFLQDKLHKDKEDLYITKKDVCMSTNEECNYEIIKIIYGYILQNAIAYANNILCVKDKFDRFEPIPNLCGLQRCGKWCNNFILVQPLNIQYFFKDKLVYLCKCNNEKTTKEKIGKFINYKISFSKNSRYKQRQKKISQEEAVESRKFNEYLKDHINK